MLEKKEEFIELEIHCLFMENWILSWHNDIKWFFNEKKWHYQRNNNNFIRRWISDVIALYKWQTIAIEVKKPSEMKFFDRDIDTLRLEFAKSEYRIKDPRRYLHALEQKEFLNDVIKNWWIGFFASSVDEVKIKLKENWIIL